MAALSSAHHGFSRQGPHRFPSIQESDKQTFLPSKGSITYDFGLSNPEIHEVRASTQVDRATFNLQINKTAIAYLKRIRLDPCELDFYCVEGSDRASKYLGKQTLQLKDVNYLYKRGVIAFNVFSVVDLEKKPPNILVQLTFSMRGADEVARKVVQLNLPELSLGLSSSISINLSRHGTDGQLIPVQSAVRSIGLVPSHNPNPPVTQDLGTPGLPVHTKLCLKMDDSIAMHTGKLNVTVTLAPDRGYEENEIQGSIYSHHLHKRDLPLERQIKDGYSVARFNQAVRVIPPVINLNLCTSEERRNMTVRLDFHMWEPDAENNGVPEMPSRRRYCFKKVHKQAHYSCSFHSVTGTEGTFFF